MRRRLIAVYHHAIALRIDGIRVGCMHIRMDWTSIAFDWNRARAFLVTAEEGSLSAAARALNMTQPTLGRQVAALEQELGVTLFERVGRGLTLTDAGARLLDHVRGMGEAARAVSLTAGGEVQEIAGDVAITASEIYAQWLLPPVLMRLREAAPGIRVTVVAANDIRDLRRREADIAIRNTQPDDAELIGKRLAQDVGTLFATPDCLARFGHPQTLADLARCDFIGFPELDGYIGALARFGVSVTLANFPILATSHPVHWEYACQGLGLGAGPCGLGDSEPRLKRVLPDAPRFDYPVWLVAHRELRTSPRVRLVWDLLARMLPDLLTDARTVSSGKDPGRQDR